jgi:hypothetical protein
MVTITKRRTIAALAAAGIALSGAVSVAAPGAQAAALTSSPRVSTTRTAVLPPTAVASTKQHPGVKDAFSAGIAGYDDGACEQLQTDYEGQVEMQNEAATGGMVQQYSDAADQLYGELTANCAVID